MTLDAFLSKLYHEYTDEDVLTHYISLINEFAPEARVLELGGGEGLICDQLNAPCVVSDINADVLALAKEKGHEVMIQDVLTPLPHDFNVYTMMSDVINYIDLEHIDTLFKNVSQALRDNAIFIFDSLNDRYLKDICPYTEEITIGDFLYQWTLNTHDDELHHQFVSYNQSFQMIQYLHTMEDIKHFIDKYNLVIEKRISLEDRDILLLIKRN